MARGTEREREREREKFCNFSNTFESGRFYEELKLRRSRAESSFATFNTGNFSERWSLSQRRTRRETYGKPRRWNSQTAYTNKRKIIISPKVPLKGTNLNGLRVDRHFPPAYSSAIVPSSFVARECASSSITSSTSFETHSASIMASPSLSLALSLSLSGIY